jgi:hypothetical protein
LDCRNRARQERFEFRRAAKGYAVLILAVTHSGYRVVVS